MVECGFVTVVDFPGAIEQSSTDFKRGSTATAYIADLMDGSTLGQIGQQFHAFNHIAFPGTVASNQQGHRLQQVDFNISKIFELDKVVHLSTSFASRHQKINSPLAGPPLVPQLGTEA